MKISLQIDVIIGLRDNGMGLQGFQFSGYGITPQIVQGKVEKVVLHMFDQNIDIE